MSGGLYPDARGTRLVSQDDLPNLVAVEGVCFEVAPTGHNLRSAHVLANVATDVPLSSVAYRQVITSDDQLLLQFEQGTLPKEQWTHTAHVRVAYMYVQRYGIDEATDRMRSGIQSLNAVHGTKDTPTGGYHETITQAWIRVLAALGDGEDPNAAPIDLFQKYPELTQSNLLGRYYSHERLMSLAARAHFVPPDITPLP